jgi:hypothetical protein
MKFRQNQWVEPAVKTSVGLGDYKSGTQFIPWEKVKNITKAEIRFL